MKRVANMKPAARMAEIERPAEKSSGGAPDPLPEVLPAGTRFNLGNGEWEFLVTARRVPGADAPGWYSGMARNLLGITDEAHVKATSIDWSSLPPSGEQAV